MKKIIVAFVAVLLVLSITSPISANGAITNAEQKIIDAIADYGIFSRRLNARVAETTTYLKQKDISDGDAEKILQLIIESKAIVDASGVDFSNVDSVQQGFAMLPADTVNQLKDKAYEAARLADVTITFNPDPVGVVVVTNTSGAGVTSNGPILKQTGNTNIESIAAFVSIMLVGVGMAVIAKKKQKVTVK